jgi:hypothetical protein
MPGHECYHCKQWVEEGEAHDCWTTTEAALTADLTEDLREAWERLRETAAEFGEQRIYASHNSIMFSRKTSYFFVRPKRTFLEVCVFLGREVRAPQIRRAEPSSKTKWVHFIPIKHRDQVEAPITEWLREAYKLSDGLATQAATSARPAKAAKPTKAATSKSVRKAGARKASKASVTRGRRSSASTRAARKSPARSGSSRGKR